MRRAVRRMGGGSLCEEKRGCADRRQEQQAQAGQVEATEALARPLEGRERRERSADSSLSSLLTQVFPFLFSPSDNTTKTQEWRSNGAPTAATRKGAATCVFLERERAAARRKGVAGRRRPGDRARWRRPPQGPRHARRHFHTPVPVPVRRVRTTCGRLPYLWRAVEGGPGPRRQRAATQPPSCDPLTFFSLSLSLSPSIGQARPLRVLRRPGPQGQGHQALHRPQHCGRVRHPGHPGLVGH